MTDVKALLGELRASDPKFDEAQAVVDLVRSSGDMLERMRERKNWSQAELAERLGITTGRVSQLESGTLRNAPSLKMMARVAHACGESVKLASSGESAFGAQTAANTTVDLSKIMNELTALRSEVQELRSAFAEQESFADVEEAEPEVDLLVHMEPDVELPSEFVTFKWPDRSGRTVVVEKIKRKKPAATPTPRRIRVRKRAELDLPKAAKAEE